MKAVKTSLFVLIFASFTGIGSGVKVVNYEQLKKMSQKGNDTLYIVNFWATWCKPCVKELPYFQEAAKKYAGQKLKMIFASLNMAKEITMVQKFADEKKMENVFIFDGGNPNVWIDKIDKNWSGSIPGTVMYKNAQKVFFKEEEFSPAELDSIINLKLK